MGCRSLTRLRYGVIAQRSLAAVLAGLLLASCAALDNPGRFEDDMPAASDETGVDLGSTAGASAQVSMQDGSGMNAWHRVQAQERPAVLAESAPPHSVLWIGSSYFYFNNSLHNHFNLLVRSLDASWRIRGVSSTISGSGLEWHNLDALLRPGAIGRYSFGEKNEIHFNRPGRTFDTAVMMDCSLCPIHPQLQQNFHDTVRAYSRRLREDGIRPVLFMSWAYKDRPEMTALLANQYLQAGRGADARVIPAGLAFARAMERIPEVELYHKDRRHPSLAGTYLAACTAYATLFRRSPEGATYTAGLDRQLASRLQVVAWETVRQLERAGSGR